jgi:hypothetical protein
LLSLDAFPANSNTWEMQQIPFSSQWTNSKDITEKPPTITIRNNSVFYNTLSGLWRRTHKFSHYNS